MLEVAKQIVDGVKRRPELLASMSIMVLILLLVNSSVSDARRHNQETVKQVLMALERAIDKCKE